MSGVHRLVAPSAITAAMTKPTNHGALRGTTATGRHASRRLKAMNSPPKTRTTAKIATCSPRANQ